MFPLGRGWCGGYDEGYLCPPHAEEGRSLQDRRRSDARLAKQGKNVLRKTRKMAWMGR